MKIKTVVGVTAAIAALSGLAVVAAKYLAREEKEVEAPEGGLQEEGEAMEPAVPEAETEPTPQETDPLGSDEVPAEGSKIVDLLELDPPLTSQEKAVDKETVNEDKVDKPAEAAEPTV